jgi:hypothetical protein
MAVKVRILNINQAKTFSPKTMGVLKDLKYKGSRILGRFHYKVVSTTLEHIEF